MIQTFVLLAYNPYLTGFIDGRIFRGPTKGICVPGLNCYSCPGAIGACPIGSLQTQMAGAQLRFTFYVVGLITVFGAALGRFTCGWLCPFGLVQELIYKIPSPKLPKSDLTRKLSYLKYAIFFLFVIALPLVILMQDGVGAPAFCKYICPAGTLQAGIPLAIANQAVRWQLGALFILKATILMITIASSACIFRPFCRFICPLGAIYSLFNRVSLAGLRLDEEKCTACGKCAQVCRMDTKRVTDHECIRCGECKDVCPERAIHGFTKKESRRRSISCEKSSLSSR